MKVTNIIFGILSSILTIFLFTQLNELPGGMFFSGLFFSIVILIFVFIAIFSLTFISKFIFKKNEFKTRFFIVTTLILLFTTYKLYSPTLKIIVPKNYYEEVNLTLSNLSKNELITDQNGIGYLTKWTFEKTYTKPKVYDSEGKNLENYLMSYNNNKFWGKSTGSGNTIKSLNFEIAKDTLQNRRNNYDSNWLEKVDIKKVHLENPTKPVDNIINVKIK